MAKTKPACDGDTLLLDQMSCLIDWIGGYLPTARKRLRLDLFSEDKREGGQNEFVCMLHDDFAPGSVGAYQDRLMATTRAILATLQEVGKRVANLAGIAAGRWRAQLGHYLPLIERILTQSQRRVLDGQAVKASEKLVSLFEPHADIIVKSLPPRRRGVPVTCSMDTSSTWPPARAA
jgi:hypothetical protein